MSVCVRGVILIVLIGMRGPTHGGKGTIPWVGITGCIKRKSELHTTMGEFTAISLGLVKVRPQGPAVMMDWTLHCRLR